MLLIIHENITTLKEENKKLKDELSSMETDDQDILKLVQEFTDEGNIEKAIGLLSGIENKTHEIEEYSIWYVEKYEMQIITEIDALISSNNFDGAENLAKNALKLSPDNEAIAKKLDSAKQSKPQFLVDILFPYETKNYTEKVVGKSMSMSGEEYYNGFELGGYKEGGYAVFNLNGEYTRITGIAGHIDGTGEADITLNIFADRMLIKTININCKNIPQEFIIDVTGVRQIKFEAEEGRTSVGLAEVTIQ